MGGDEHLSTALVAGAMAGFSVDVSLFPIDTIKTRLQSSGGFLQAGGFRNIYSGVMATATGSMPAAALFFCTYELVKNVASQSGVGEQALPIVHCTAACTGEVLACLVRVPTEVVKQRAQIGKGARSMDVLLGTIRAEGVRGLYRGLIVTVLREVPFSFLQFPMWEMLKAKWAAHTGRDRVDAWQSGFCGALSGGLAAGITTPLDVAKTRIMVAKAGTLEAQAGLGDTIRIIYHQRGLKGLFSGIVPRVTWISLGGAIFLGVYDKVKSVLNMR